jgi:hypothetical protein
MLIVLGQNRYDVPHAIHAAQRIKETKPDAVILELPEKPFQSIINNYLKRGNEQRFLKQVAEAVGKELNIDHKLIEKFEKGHMTVKQLEMLEPDASFVHIVITAKKMKIPVYAVDIPMADIEKEVRQVMKFSSTAEDRAIKEAREVLMGLKPVNFMRWAHEPFNVLEIIIGHHPERHPFDHPPECPICKLGVKWERFAHVIGATFASILPVNKTLVALRHFDLVREEKIANKIINIYGQIKKKKAKPNVFSILHIWHEDAIEGKVKRKGIKIREIQ